MVTSLVLGVASPALVGDWSVSSTVSSGSLILSFTIESVIAFTRSPGLNMSGFCDVTV
jgi:hypothetical protein